jgi:hypothetical protein
LEAVNHLSNDPIRHLINTHWHFDHADGNEWLNAEGAAIVAHENTHKRLMAAHRVEDWDFNFSAPPLPAVPTEVFCSDKNLKSNGIARALRHYEPVHRGSDISITFADADIFHADRVQAAMIAQRPRAMWARPSSALNSLCPSVDPATKIAARL